MTATTATGSDRSLADAIAFTDGTHRVCTPEETWERIAPLLPRAGITRVADVTWLDTLGVPVWQAVRPESLLLSVSQGKGATHTAAKVSAAMEALETWHAEMIPVDRCARAVDLDLGYDPHDLHLQLGSLYHERATIGWVAASGLVTGASTWLPHQLLDLDFRPLYSYAPPLFQPTSTGLASGNTWDEASLHGLLEVLERESLCAAADLPRRLVDHASVTDPACRHLIASLSAGDNDLVIHDVTVHDAVPCYSAKLRSAGLGLDFEGSGAHLDPRIALSRALTEAAQSRATCLSGARDDIDQAVYRVLGQQIPSPTALSDPDGTVVAFRRPPDAADTEGSGASIAQALARTASVAARWLGHEPLVARLDRGLGVPVVRVVVPGARRDESGTTRRPDQGAAR